MMSEEKYEVIQAFTKEDYIVAHHIKYRWTNYKSSCKEFQDDMDKWGAYFSNIDGVKLGSIYDIQKYNLSNNFWEHAVKFGFIKRVEEVFYKVGDKFDCGCGIRYLVRVDVSTVQLVSFDNYYDPNKANVKNVFKISKEELESLSKYYKEFTKIEE